MDQDRFWIAILPHQEAGSAVCLFFFKGCGGFHGGFFKDSRNVLYFFLGLKGFRRVIGFPLRANGLIDFTWFCRVPIGFIQRLL